MTSVEPGTRIVLRCGRGAIGLRALGGAELDGGDWEVPVLASVGALRDGAGVIEIVTPSGLLSVPAHLAVVEGRLTLRAGEGSRVTFLQRRDDVRGPLALPLRGSLLDDGRLDDTVVEGTTTTVSGGGVSLVLDPSAPRGRAIAAVRGSRLYLELELPGGDLAPAVVRVVDDAGARGAADARPGLLRGVFVDISPRDRERLVRLVFDRERRSLAGRPRAAGVPG